MIKKLLFVATAFVAISMSANAQTISFETSEGYSLGDIHGQNGWISTPLQSGGNIEGQEVTSEDATDGGNSLKITTLAGVPAQSSIIVGAFYNFDSFTVSGEKEFSFDVKFTASDENNVWAIQFISEGLDEAGEPAMFLASEIAFLDGTIFYNLGDDQEIDFTDNQWQSNTWVNVKVIVDTDNNTNSYYIDGTLIDTGVNLFEGEDLIQMRFVSNNGGGNAYLDNLKINEAPSSTENFAKLGLNVFPNPVSDIVNITSPEANIQAVTITDLNGRTVKSINFNNVAETTVDASDLASGIYLMNITANGTVATQKIVKK